MTAHFQSHLDTRTIGERRWLLLQPLIFYSRKYDGHVVAPAGFSTNLASIPRIAWSIIPKVGKYDKAAVIHDAGYANALMTIDGRRIFCVKRVSDDLFDEGMRAEGVNDFVRWFMANTVRVFGDPKDHPLANALPGDAAMPRATTLLGRLA